MVKTVKNLLKRLVCSTSQMVKYLSQVECVFTKKIINLYLLKEDCMVCQSKCNDSKVSPNNLIVNNSSWWTTNCCESFHSHFNTEFYHTHPNIVNLFNVLLDVQIDMYRKINSANRNCKKESVEVRRSQEHLGSLILRYASNDISKFYFVKQISFKYLPWMLPHL